jgi:hypothetical protein
MHGRLLRMPFPSEEVLPAHDEARISFNDGRTLVEDLSPIANWQDFVLFFLESLMSPTR